MKINGILLQLAGVLGLLLSSACSKEEAPFIIRDTDMLSFSYAASVKTFTVCTDGDWSVSADQNDWVSFEPASGRGDGITREVVTVNLTRNLGSARSGRITILAAGREVFIDVTQDEGFMTFGNLSLTLPLALDESLQNAFIAVPYFKGLTGEGFMVTATVSGPGAGGINVPATTVTLTEENGTFYVPITGTPTTEGQVNVSLSMLGLTAGLQSAVIRSSNNDPAGTVYLEQRFDLLTLGGDHVGKAAGIHLVGAWPTVDGRRVLPPNPVFETSGTANTDGTGDYFSTMHASFVAARGLEGWTGLRVYERPGYLKISTAASTDGYIALPPLAAIAGVVDVKVTFKAARWSENASNDANAKLIIGILNAGTSTSVGPEISLIPTWEDKEFIVRGATAETVIQFKAKATGNNRFMVDDIVVSKIID